MVYINLRSNWSRRTGIVNFEAGLAGVLCFERTTQIDVRIIEEESVIYRPKSHVVLAYVGALPTRASDDRCAWPRFFEIVSFTTISLYPLQKWSPVSALMKKHLGSLKKTDWSQDARAVFMDSEGYALHDLEVILSRLHSVLKREPDQERPDLTSQSLFTLVAVILIAIKDFQCLGYQCGEPDPVLSLSRFACFRGDGSFLNIDDRYPGILEVGRLYLSSRCGFEALSGNPDEIYLQARSLEELEAFVLVAHICTCASRLVLRTNCPLVPGVANAANLQGTPMVHPMVDIQFPRLFQRIEVAWVENLNSISVGEHADTLRRAIGDESVVANDATANDCFRRHVKCRLAVGDNTKGSLFYGGEREGMRSQRMANLIRLGAALIYEQKFGDEYD